MRIGLLSDVHGNLAALSAVRRALAEEAERGPLDAVIVAGDHLFGGPRPHRVWEALLETRWSLVLGNEDVALMLDDVPEAAPSPGAQVREAYKAQHAWMRDRLDPAVVRALAALPREHRLATPAGDLLVVHSSPRSLDDRSGGPHNTAAEVAAAYGGTGATAIAFGHYHHSFVRPAPFALLVNVASVSLPIDGRPLAAYSILTATPAGWIVEQHHVPYDDAEERAAAAAAGQPAWLPGGTS